MTRRGFLRLLGVAPVAAFATAMPATSGLDGASAGERLTLAIHCDTSALVTQLDQFSALLAEAGERFAQPVHGAVDLIEALAHLRVVDLDPLAASGARDLLVVAEPAHGLDVLVAAARARNGQFPFIKDALRHIESPSVVCTPMVDAAPVGGNPGRSPVPAVHRGGRSA